MEDPRKSNPSPRLPHAAASEADSLVDVVAEETVVDSEDAEADSEEDSPKEAQAVEAAAEAAVPSKADSRKSIIQEGR